VSVVSSGPPTGLSSTPRENNPSRTARFPVRAEIFPDEQTFILLRPITCGARGPIFEMQSSTQALLRWSCSPRPRRVIFGAPHKMPDQVKRRAMISSSRIEADYSVGPNAPAAGAAFYAKHRAIAERSGWPPVRGVWLRALDNSASIIWAQRSRSTSAPTAGWPDVWCWF
jgi:hypothetical protein